MVIVGVVVVGIRTVAQHIYRLCFLESRNRQIRSRSEQAAGIDAEMEASLIVVEIMKVVGVVVVVRKTTTAERTI